jgi:cytochrome c oxidase subunit 3
MAEDVNFLHNKAANGLKMNVPILLRESHETGALFHDQTDFEVLSRRQGYRIKSPVIPEHFSRTYKVPTSEIMHTFIYRFREADELYANSSKININFYSPGVLINPYRIPLLNTAILLTSGFILTMAHSYLRVESFLAAFRFLLYTIVMGVLFIMLQLYEYTYSGFSMNDGVYGSIFYMLTGFHGFHVIVGTIFLIVCLCRLKASHFTSNNHFAFEAAA